MFYYVSLGLNWNYLNVISHDIMTKQVYFLHNLLL